LQHTTKTWTVIDTKQLEAFHMKCQQGKGHERKDIKLNEGNLTPCLQLLNSYTENDKTGCKFY